MHCRLKTFSRFNISIMEKHERLKALINHLTDGIQKIFVELLSTIPQVISAWLTRNNYDVELIYQKCDSVSVHWLLSGEGDMIKKNLQFVDAENGELIQLCKSLDENYLQRDAVMNKLVSMVKGLE